MRTSQPVLIYQGIPDLVPMVRTGDPVAHVSYRIRKLCVAMEHFAIREDDATDPDRLTRMEMGSAFEHAIIEGLKHRWSEAYPERFVSPGELSLDGLIGTPDLFDLVDNCVTEIKLTWISTRNDHDSEKFWKYWVQLMAYCYMMGVTMGRLHVGFVMGGYKKDRPPSPEYRIYECNFTEQDLYENWRMLLNAA